MKPWELKFKDKDVYMSNATHAHCHRLAEIEFWVLSNFGMLVTCAHRRSRHSNDLHGTDPVRAKDIRSWCYKDPEKVVAAINAMWVYDPSRPHMLVAVYHDAGSGKHIHLQSHPHTTIRVRKPNV